jgi:phosphatidylinositol 3-kinase
MYNFFTSCDITRQVRVKIGWLDLKKVVSRQWSKENDDSYRDDEIESEKLTAGAAFYCTVSLHSNNGKLLGLASRTSYGRLSGGRRCSWNEWLVFSLKYKELPLDTRLSCTVWSLVGARRQEILGSTSLPLFTESRTLRKGRQRLTVYDGVESDLCGHASHGKMKQACRDDHVGDEDNDDDDDGAWCDRSEPIRHLERLVKRYERNEMQHIDWLDRLALRRVSVLRDSLLDEHAASSFLNIEFPCFERPVLFYERPALAGDVDDAAAAAAAKAKSSRRRQLLNRARRTVSDPSSPSLSSSLVQVVDRDMREENPVEKKHRKLARSVRRGLFDRNIKATTHEKRQIERILAYPPTKVLSDDEKQFLWRFRYVLNSNPKALPKFLSSVDFEDAQQAQRAAAHLKRWAPISFTEALELFSSRFQSAPMVRDYAIHRAMAASDDELLTFLMPLVQSLRYDFPLRRRADPAAEGVAVVVVDTPGDAQASSSMRPAPPRRTHLSLAQLLVDRAKRNFVLANKLLWFLQVESDEVFKRTLSMLTTALPGQWMATFKRQKTLVDKLERAAAATLRSKSARDRKIERLRAMLGEGGSCDVTDCFEPPLPMPMDPTLSLTGVLIDRSHVYKSNQAPIRLTFTSIRTPRAIMLSRESGSSGKETSTGGGIAATATADDSSAAPSTYTIIFKVGDDLRQDQVIVRMVQLMNDLLRKEQLDLRLTPYMVMATSPQAGMIECVPNCRSIGQILAADGRIKLDSASRQMDTFVRSCAGYSVITYILGVGDRHLDNLMLTDDGRLFHIDFGYIFGRDPKPFPPPMKFCKEMVEGMGGYHAPAYTRFKELSCEAYNILRQSANLILNLFALLVDADITDIRFFGPEKSLLKLAEKFSLQLSDEQASHAFQQLINESVTALFPQLSEVIHRYAQYWAS